MDDLEKVLTKHTAGPQSIGYDYQFYLFMFLLLDLKHGQSIGFEVKDDVHIDKADGTTILFQAKHTVLKNSDGTSKNLTSLDSDLWKSLSNWSEFIKKSHDPVSFLTKHSFCLVTNKSEDNNEFIDSFLNFKTEKDINKVLTTLKALENKAKDKNVKTYIKNISSLGKRKLTTFLLNLTIDNNTDDIIGKIKNRILERVMYDNFIDPVFESLSSNLQLDKYLEIGERKFFVITFEDFKNKYGKCFSVAYELKPLPKRHFNVDLPEKLEDQTFIKQLLDIGEISQNSPQILDYTTLMLQALNQFSFWAEKNFILPLEIKEFENNSIRIWDNEFRAKYRKIEKAINLGASIESLESEIQSLGIELVEYLRRQDLSLQKNILGIELSNGHFYVLSNNPEIGWHYQWQEKYKK